MLPFLNVFFLVFHTLWMLFNCLGWAWRRTRPWHLLTLVLTAFSWFVLGWWYGSLGFCICTEWHWRVRSELGYPPRFRLLHSLSVPGADRHRRAARLADVVTGGVFAVTVLLSISLNLRHFFRRRRGR